MDGNGEGSRELYVHYEIDGKKFEAKGNRDDVNKHTAVFISLVSPDKPVQLRMPEFINIDAPLLSDNSASNVVVTGESHKVTESSHNQDSQNLTELYLKTWSDDQNEKATQQQQILLVNHYYEVCLRQEFTSLQDYENAYGELAKIPVDTPANIRARAAELVKDGNLHKTGTGQFALTIRGKKYIDAIINRNRN